ncbi:pollen-specific leucine-rich repeat extensin-like protein 3 [Iris pallida]|uniref:Pollen-specific leucine-rich repeat extensin-like protein 3 n=1 Tax=Iris pallida TaxID=29817 RepID=A0AAX6FN42_IRIPA|nr:pollen-specific leucine-rich repeat extensin-like protein 3 [Iris pallida]
MRRRTLVESQARSGQSGRAGHRAARSERSSRGQRLGALVRSLGVPEARARPERSVRAPAAISGTA